MKIRTRKQGDVLIIDLEGNLTVVEGAEELRQFVQESVDGGKRNFLFNLVKLGHIDSAGIGCIVACFTLVSKKKGALKLLRLDSKLERLLSVVERFEDEEAAVASFRSR